MVGIVDAGIAHIVVVADIGRRQGAGVFIQRVTARPLGGQGHVAGYRITVKVPVHAVFRLPGDEDTAVFYRIIRLPYMAAEGNFLTFHCAAAASVEAHNSGALPDVVDRTIGNGDIRAAAVKGTAESLSNRGCGGGGVLLVPGPAEEGAARPVSCLCYRILAQVGVISCGQGAAGEDLAIRYCDAAAGLIMDGQAVLQRAVFRLMNPIGQCRVEMKLQQIGLPQQVLGGPFVGIDLVLKADGFPNPDAGIGFEGSVGNEGQLGAVVEPPVVEGDDFFDRDLDADLKLGAEIVEKHDPQGDFKLKSDFRLSLYGQRMRRVAGKDRAVGVVNDPLFGSVIIMLLCHGIVCKTIFQAAGEREDKVTADIEIEQRRLEMKIA